MTGHWTWTIAAATLAGATVSATAAAPSMSSAWLSINVSQEECVRKGTAIVRRSGFERRFEVLANSAIYAERGDYTALVRCAAEKGIVYFVVAGPDGPTCNGHMSAMREGF